MEWLGLEPAYMKWIAGVTATQHERFLGFGQAFIHSLCLHCAWLSLPALELKEGFM